MFCKTVTKCNELEKIITSNSETQIYENTIPKNCEIESVHTSFSYNFEIPCKQISQIGRIAFYENNNAFFQLLFQNVLIN